jgi:predicted nuclease of predicted toxin-antitoxin system
MRFKLDENVTTELAGRLSDRGHDVATVFGQGWAGKVDEELLPMLREEDRILITQDVGIADILRFPPGRTAGIILYRPETAGAAALMSLFESTLSSVLSLPLSQSLVVVTVHSIRIRR